MTISRQLSGKVLLYFINQKKQNMKTYLLLVLSAFVFTFTSCTKDCEDTANISDTSLESVTHSEDFVLARTTHQDDGGEWKIKMNSVAAKAYAEGIKNFPSSSMIVKEKYVNGQMTGYAVMFRAPADKNSSDGWL